MKTASGVMNDNVNHSAFDELLARLEPSLQTVDGRYNALRKKMIKFFAWRQVREPEALADETISRLAKNVLSGRELEGENPYSYVYAIAVHVYREYGRAIKKEADIIKEWQDRTDFLAEDSDDCRKECLQKLSQEKLDLLMHYHVIEKDKNKMAEKRGMTRNALGIQIHRIHKEVRDCLKKCLKSPDSARN